MRQTYTIRQAGSAGAERHHDGSRNRGGGPNHSARRNGTGRAGARLRIVAAPGGVAFVEDKPALKGEKDVG